MGYSCDVIPSLSSFVPPSFPPSKPLLPSSDGVGRTGAFLCIYSQLERVKTEGVADIFQYIKGSRFQRSGLVQKLVNISILTVVA